MKTKLFISILLVTLAMALFGQNVGPKMCKVCGKPFSQCQYRGRHPQNTENTQPAKPASQSSSKPSNAPISKQTFTVDKVSFRMVRVEGGTFKMGAMSDQDGEAKYDEKPAHQVTLSTYSIGETEVTQELWEAVMGSNPSEFKGAKRPVEHVSWKDCQNFIKKLNEKTKQNFRLPTEAEWEYAARGGSRSQGYKYSGSNSHSDVAWCTDNSKGKTHNVREKQSNELGLYDMSGNVFEWCQDWYGNYSRSSQTNPKGSGSGTDHVRRGGGWNRDAERCRSSSRSCSHPDVHTSFLGLRLALSETSNDKVDKTNKSALIEQSESFLGLSGSFADNKGKLPYPIDAPYTYIDHYNPSIGISSILLRTSTEAHACAIFEGVVQSCSKTSDEWTVIVQHGNYRSVYVKLQNVFVHEGQKVSTLQKLGTLIVDPVSNYAEIRFWIYQNTTAVNPEHWLKH